MKRKEMTLKRILAPLAHEGELQRDEWIPAFAGMTAEGSSVDDGKSLSLFPYNMVDDSKESGDHNKKDLSPP